MAHNVWYLRGPSRGFYGQFPSRYRSNLFFNISPKLFDVSGSCCNPLLSVIEEQPGFIEALLWYRIPSK